MYILAAKIEIGDFVFRSVNEVEITKSVAELVDTAIIKMPTKFRVKSNNDQKFIEECIKPGDKVKITLAYEGKYEGVEFRVSQWATHDHTNLNGRFAWNITKRTKDLFNWDKTKA